MLGERGKKKKRTASTNNRMYFLWKYRILNICRIKSLSYCWTVLDLDASLLRTYKVDCKLHIWQIWKVSDTLNVSCTDFFLFFFWKWTVNKYFQEVWDGYAWAEINSDVWLQVGPMLPGNLICGTCFVYLVYVAVVKCSISLGEDGPTAQLNCAQNIEAQQYKAEFLAAPQNISFYINKNIRA